MTWGDAWFSQQSDVDKLTLELDDPSRRYLSAADAIGTEACTLGGVAEQVAQA
jgi:hypothetical protein